jgi:anaerobic C4-dicarboxylate transporter DcuA/anaerobic C4-dicarboxylate transporter DcuB
VNVSILLQVLVVIGAIVLGVRMGGLGLGLWGVAGVGVLVFGFGLAPGSPPGSAMLIILAVITAAAAMQAAGGIDFLVRVATKIIQAHPSRINYIAPLVSFIFTIAAGTSNIFYPLLPVIYQTAYDNGIRPERPLATATVANVYGITCSPVSAAMAAMLTLVAVPQYGFNLGKILLITIPSATVAIIAMAFVQNFIGKSLAEDTEYQERLKAGLVPPPKSDAAADEPVEDLPKGAAMSAYLFLIGVVLVVLTAFPAFQKMVPGANGPVAVSATTVIQIVMFVVALLIVLLAKVDPAVLPSQSIFGAGIVAILALFGIAWLADTFVAAWNTQIVALLSNWVTAVPLLFAFALFILAALTTSQSATTRTLVPIGLAILPVGPVVAMWQALSGVLFLPANGTQLAAVAVDQTGSTKIGKLVVNHSFMIPLLVSTVVAIAVGLLIARFV